MHLQHLSQMRALIKLDADNAKAFASGQRVDLQVDVPPNQSLDGTLTAILNQKDAGEDSAKAWDSTTLQR